MNVSLSLEGGTTDFLEDERAILRDAFLKKEGFEKTPLIPLPVDASKRRYFRLPQALLMDAPPPHEKTMPFEFISQLLQEVGLSVPCIYAADHEQGFLLIEDFGELSYRKALQTGLSEKLLYEETINALIQLHRKLPQNTLNLDSYDLDLFIKNACLFIDWYGISFPQEAKSSFKEVWKEAYQNQPQLPSSLMMKDVMVDNLLWLDKRQEFKRCGFIDFQDGLWGPISYDLVSLLEDARRDVSPSFAKEMIHLYFNAFPTLSQNDFWESYYLWGAQRSTRILGVFSRLAKRDGKTHYLNHLPRLWKYLKQDLQHPKLKKIQKWFDQHVWQKSSFPH